MISPYDTISAKSDKVDMKASIGVEIYRSANSINKYFSKKMFWLRVTNRTVGSQYELILTFLK